MPLRDLMNSPDDDAGTRLNKLVVRQCALMPVVVIVVVLLIGLAWILVHH